MKDFLKLIRLPNLIVVAATMYLIRYFVLQPLAGNMFIVLSDPSGDVVPLLLQLSRFDFGILVFATVLITAGGYAINDYFDVKTDLINRGKVIVGTSIPRRKAMMWHSLLSFMGIVAGFYVSFRIGYFMLGILFMLVSGLLYFYSSTYKRQFLLGNIIVAILVGMIPMLISIYEVPLLFKHYSPLTASLPELRLFFWWTAGFGLFAFLTTLTREIVKDIADYEGDAAYGRRTLPVVVGFRGSKIVVSSIALVTALLLIIVWWLFINDIVTLIYLSATVILPLFLFIILVMRGEGYKKMTTAGNLLKFIMVGGILYSVVVKILLF